MAAPPESPLNALLGRGASYEGDLSFEGRVRVDGHFRGRIYTDECLEIGREGRVDGEIDAQDVVLAGLVVGQLRVRGLLRITPTGRVSGAIDAEKLCMEPGACLSAVLQVGDQTGLPAGPAR